MEPEAAPVLRAPLRAAYEFQCTEGECVAALQFNQSRLLRRWSHSATGITLRILTFAAGAGCAFFAAALAVAARGSAGRWLACCLVVALILTTFSQLAIRRSFFRRIAAGDGTMRRRRTLILAEEGLRFRDATGETVVAWNGIRSIEQLEGQILVYLDDVSCVPISASAFSDSAERAEFLADLRRRAGSSTPPAEPASSQATLFTAATEVAREGRGGWANFFRHLVRGLRLALFLRPEMDGSAALDASWSTLVALLLLDIALSFLRDLLKVGFKGSFYPGAIPEATFGVPVMIVGSWALARLCGRARDTLALLVALASLAIPLDLVDGLVELVIKGRLERLAQQETPFVYLSSFLVPIWFALAASVAAIRLFGAPWRRWLRAVLLTGLLVGLPLMLIDRHPTLWWAPQDEEPAASDHQRRVTLANEDVFYLQPKLLEQQLAALKPGRRGVIDLYFIGLAAYARQDVFMKEVHSVTKLFDDRFDTAGRSLMLINNAATIGESPIASSTSLRMALKRVAEIMDRDEDILFLFITSHGSREHLTTFDFWPMQFNVLDPGRLKALLDQSGIKRRVVVVSSCYSGGFVDALKDDETLAIAASAADKNSFGCSDDTDFTYFGKAYFDEALRKTYSFSEAFDIARPLIAERERAARFQQSNPRMFMGKGIKQALDEFVSARESAVKGGYHGGDRKK